MINTKLTDGTIPNLTSPANTDLFYVVDVSDSTDDPAGTSKVITYANLLKSTTDRLDAEHNSDGTHSDITATSVTATTGTYTDIITGSMDASGAVLGNTITADSSVITDTINEKTASAGVTIDGTLIKDNTVAPTGAATDIDLTLTGKGAGKVLVNLTNSHYIGTPNMSLANNTGWQDVTGVTVTVTTRKASKVFVSSSFYFAISSSYSNFGCAVRIVHGTNTEVGTPGYWDPRQADNVTTSLTGYYTSTGAETVTFKLQASKGDASAVFVIVKANLDAVVIPD